MMPSPEQIAHMQRQLAIDAEKMGMTVPQFIGELRTTRQVRRLLLTAQNTSRSKPPRGCSSNSSSSNKAGNNQASTSTSTPISINTSTSSSRAAPANLSPSSRARPTPSRYPLPSFYAVRS